MLKLQCNDALVGLDWAVQPSSAGGPGFQTVSKHQSYLSVLAVDIYHMKDDLKGDIFCFSKLSGFQQIFFRQTSQIIELEIYLDFI